MKKRQFLLHPKIWKSYVPQMTHKQGEKNPLRNRALVPLPLVARSLIHISAVRAVQIATRMQSIVQRWTFLRTFLRQRTALSIFVPSGILPDLLRNGRLVNPSARRQLAFAMYTCLLGNLIGCSYYLACLALNRIPRPAGGSIVIEYTDATIEDIWFIQYVIFGTRLEEYKSICCDYNSNDSCYTNNGEACDMYK